MMIIIIITNRNNKLTLSNSVVNVSYYYDCYFKERNRETLVKRLPSDWHIIQSQDNTDS